MWPITETVTNRFSLNTTELISVCIAFLCPLIDQSEVMPDVRLPIEKPLNLWSGARHNRHDPRPVASHHRIPVNTKGNTDRALAVAAPPTMIRVINCHQIPEPQLVDAEQLHKAAVA